MDVKADISPYKNYYIQVPRLYRQTCSVKPHTEKNLCKPPVMDTFVYEYWTDFVRMSVRDTR